MTFQQAYYTSSETGLRETKGFQINAASPDVGTEVLDRLEALGGYTPPASAPARPSSEEIALFPVSLFYHLLRKDLAVVGQSRYVGTDYSGRFGNYFVHYVLVDHPNRALRSLFPIEMWRSHDWATTASSSVTLDPLEALPSKGELARPMLYSFLSDARHRRWLEPVIAAVQESLTTGRRVLLVCDCDEVARWIGAVTYLLPKSISLLLTFTTYVRNPYNTDSLLTGTTPDTDFGFEAFEVMQQFSVFDFDGQRSSPSRSTPLARFLSELLNHGSVDALQSFAEFADQVDPSLEIADLDIALECYRIARGEQFDSLNVASMISWVTRSLSCWDSVDLDKILAWILLQCPTIETAAVEHLLATAQSARTGEVNRAVVERQLVSLVMTKPATAPIPLVNSLGQSKLLGETLTEAKQLLEQWIRKLSTIRDARVIAAHLTFAASLQLIERESPLALHLGRDCVAWVLEDSGIQQFLGQSTPFADPLYEGIAQSLESGRLTRRATESIPRLYPRLTIGAQRTLLSGYLKWLFLNARQLSADVFSEALGLVKQTRTPVQMPRDEECWVEACIQARDTGQFIAMVVLGIELGFLESPDSAERLGRDAVGPRLSYPAVRNFSQGLREGSGRRSVLEGVADFLDLKSANDRTFADLAEFLRDPRIHKTFATYAEEQHRVGLYCRLQEAACADRPSERPVRFQECLGLLRRLNHSELVSGQLLTLAFHSCCPIPTPPDIVAAMVQQLSVEELAHSKAGSRVAEAFASVSFLKLFNAASAEAAEKVLAASQLDRRQQSVLRVIVSAVKKAGTGFSAEFMDTWNYVPSDWRQEFLDSSIAQALRRDDDSHILLLTQGEAADPIGFLYAYGSSITKLVSTARTTERVMIFSRFLTDWANVHEELELTVRIFKEKNRNSRDALMGLTLISPTTYLWHELLPKLAAYLSWNQVLEAWTALLGNGKALRRWTVILCQYPLLVFRWRVPSGWKRFLGVLMVGALVAIGAWFWSARNDPFRGSAQVFADVFKSSDSARDLLDEAQCVVIYSPVRKALFAWNNRFRGSVISCRSGEDFNGPWSAPAMLAMEGGSPRFPIGGQTTGFVLLIMDKADARSLISRGVKLGKDVKVVAALADVRTDILFCSTQAASGGVSLDGPTLYSDNGVNKELYGKDLSARDILRDRKVRSPATELVTLLQKTSPKYLGKAQAIQ